MDKRTAYLEWLELKELEESCVGFGEDDIMPVDSILQSSGLGLAAVAKRSSLAVSGEEDDDVGW